VVVNMGGGYADPIQPSVEAHAQVFLDAAAVFGYAKETEPLRYSSAG
jgi:hypothetical protein